MIKINFSPVRSDEQTTATLSGLVLTVNSEAFDLSEIPDGATVNHPVIQNCTRNGDDFELTLTLTHGSTEWTPTVINKEVDRWFEFADEKYPTKEQLFAALPASVKDDKTFLEKIFLVQVMETQDHRASHEQRFPEAIEVVGDGEVVLPLPEIKTATHEVRRSIKELTEKEKVDYEFMA